MLPAYVINLEKRADRRDWMLHQAEQLGVAVTIVAAIDAKQLPSGPVSPRIADAGHRIGMGRGSQACAETTLRLFESIAAGSAPAALILQDDVELASDLPQLLQSVDWLPADAGLVQLEKYGRARSRRLLGPAHPCGTTTRSLHRLLSRTAGAGAFVITRAAARSIIVRGDRLDMPIDHYLFNANISPIPGDVGLYMVRPCMARQKIDEFQSDMDAERREHRERRKTGFMKLRRLYFEINRAPQQVAALMRGARFKTVQYEDRPRLTQPGEEFS